MKNFRISIAVLLCSMVALTSCEEENITPSQSHSSETLKKGKPNLKDGGEEEDWIIIRGVVESQATTGAISGAEVILFNEDFTVSYDTMMTNSLGEFEFENDTNSYAFKVSAEGYQTLLSNSYAFPESNPVTLSLIED